MIFDKPPYRWERVRKIYTAQEQLIETPEERKLSRLFSELCESAKHGVALFAPDEIPEEGPKVPMYYDGYRIFCKETYDKGLFLQVLEREKRRLEKAPNVRIVGVGMGWLREFGLYNPGCRTRYGMRVDSVKQRSIIYDGVAWFFDLEVDSKLLNTIAINWEGDVICSTDCVLEHHDHNMPFHGLYTRHNLLTWALGPGLYDSGYLEFYDTESRDRKLAALGRVLEQITVKGSAKRVGRDPFGEVVAFYDNNWHVISGRRGTYSTNYKPVEMLPEFADKLLEKFL